MFDPLFEDWIVWLIPVIAAVVGWGTNVVAVQMMFRPVDFFGVKPWLGWQGIVPANARSLAAKSTDLITTKLINLKSLFSDFDADGFAGNLDAALDELTDQIIEENTAKYAPAMWAGLNDAAKQQVRALVRAEIQAVSVKILDDVGSQIEDLLDLKSIVVETAHRDRALIGEMFQTIGSDEFKFIKRSGAYFGLAFGIVQMFVWVLYPAWWVLPFFGFFVGYATNYLAIKLIFEPKEPKKVGPFVVHGLFHKRQLEVAEEFSALVSGEILNTDNMVQYMVSGEQGARFFGIVDRHLDELLERYKQHPMAKMIIPEEQWDDIRAEIGQRMREEIPKPGGFLHIFTSRAINVYNELVDRMKQLDSESFEGVLRPAFQKDEWKLILAGAILGLGAGILQVLYLFGDQLA